MKQAPLIISSRSINEHRLNQLNALRSIMPISTAISSNQL